MAAWKWICGFVCIVVVAIVAVVLLWVYDYFKEIEDVQPIATCGNCHCILYEPGDEPFGKICPIDVPKSDYSNEVINALDSQIALNPIILTCNPYDNNNDKDCNTIPPIDNSLIDLGEDAVCAIHYVPITESDNNNTTNNEFCEGTNKYQLMTYPSYDDAITNGGFITHYGSCGVCSTTQDLAAYMKHPDLIGEAKKCAKQAIVDIETAIECYTSLGLSDSCAVIWASKSYNTEKECIKECAFSKTIQNDPNNGEEPFCLLNDCLQCNEDKSNEIFIQYAGRTQRRSSLLSSIAEPCDTLYLFLHESCPATIPLLLPEN